jgi:hypothetical protein
MQLQELPLKLSFEVDTIEVETSICNDLGLLVNNVLVKDDVVYANVTVLNVSAAYMIIKKYEQSVVNVELATEDGIITVADI